MKYVKILGLLAVAATALMAFAGTASANVTTEGVKIAKITATSTNTQLHGTIGIICTHSVVEATGMNAAGTAPEAGGTTGRVDKLTFTGCNRTVHVTNRGHLVIHFNGEVFSTGARVTVQTTIFGIPVHCIYTTNATKVGNLTEGVAPAKLHIGSAPIDQEVTSGACGDDAVLTGTYTVTNPKTAINVH